MNKRLTIADIAASVLKERGRSGFISDDTEFLNDVFVRSVKRGVMKHSNIDWIDRVLSGVERSEGFLKSDFNGRRTFTLKNSIKTFTK